MRGVWRAGGIALMGLSALSFGGAAGAQPGKKPAAATLDPKALELFNEGKALMESQDYAAASSKFEESLRVQRGIGTLYKLGECQEKLGKTASAWSTFSDVAAAADEAGQPDRARAAREKVQALGPKLSKLRIVVLAEADAPDLDVQKDGISVSRVIWGKEVPIDPGEHTVTATAPGRSPWTKTLDIKGPAEALTVEVPALLPARASITTSGVGGSAKDTAAPPPAKRSLVPVLVLGGSAVVGLGAGFMIFLLSNSKIAEGENITNEIITVNGTCREERGPVHARCADLASTKKTVNTLDGIAIGAASLGGLALVGMVVYLALPSPAPRTTGLNVKLVPTAGRDSGGLLLSGSF